MPTDSKIPSTVSKKVYLPGLHGLRFFAAFSVFYSHLEQGKGWMGYGELLGFPLAPGLGSDGVSFFFVLSGFLITYLLLIEQQTTGTINIPNFYKRRLLRIWPLYYAFTLLVFLVLPHIPFLRFPVLDMAIEEDWWTKLGLFLLMSPHVAITLLRHPGVGGPLWSVGVEEYFYLAWPHLIKRLRNVLPWVFAVVILVPFLFRISGSELQRTFFTWARFDCMGIGGLGAWLYFHHETRLRFVFSVPAQLIAYTMAGIHIFHRVPYDKFGVWVYSLVYLTILMNVALNPKSFFKLENRFFRYMGEISYGFYVFHWLVIVICTNTLVAMGGIEHAFTRSVVLFASTFTLTTALASLSYFLWERRFLRLKAKSTTVVAGLTAKS